MSSLLMTAILFALAGSTALLFHKRIEEQLPFAVTGIVLVLYVFSLADHLLLGAHAVLGLTGAAAVFILLKAWKIAWRGGHKHLLTPGCAAFFLIAAWLFCSYRGYLYTEWDDFSHWGLAVKNMSLFAALPSGVQQATITYTDYPPASTLFSWFWTWLSGGFNEGDTQRALNMMMFCFLLPLMKEQEWRKPVRALAMSSLLFVLPLAVGQYVYRTLQVDALLGCIILYVLYSWFFGERTKTVLMNICLALCTVTLVKENGVLLAGMALAIMLLDESAKAVKGKHTVITGGMLVLSCVAGFVSWKCYIRFHQIHEVWSKDFLFLKDALEMFSGTAPSYRYQTLNRFVEYLCKADWWHPGHWFRVSHVMWILLIAAAQCWVVDLSPTEQMKRRCRRVFVLLTAEMLGYLVLLLGIYLFRFRVDEAENLISLDRYISSFLLPLIGFTLMSVERAARQKCVKHGQNAPVYLLIGFLMVVSPYMVAQNTALVARQNIAAYELRMSELIPENVYEQLDYSTDRVYIVASNDNGYQYYLGAYQMTPVPVQQGMWTSWLVANKRLDRAELPAIEYSSQEWASVLIEGSFTHVYLDTIDRRFVRDYQSLFESKTAIRSGRLYRVEERADGVKLISMP